jgi:phosphate:Na+ symporter
VTLLLLPCVGSLVWLAKRVVPGREVQVDTAPRYLGNEFLNAPAVAVTQARNEVLRMGEMTSTMLFACRDALLSGDRTHVATVFETEEVVDVLWRTIGDFLDQIDLGKLSLRDAK